MSRGTWAIGKEEALGEQGMVAANHPLAAEVGLDVLKRGGNAVDAAASSSTREMALCMGERTFFILAWPLATKA